MTPNSFRGGWAYSQRGDGANSQPLRPSPLTPISKDIRVWSLVERIRDLLSKEIHNTQGTSVSSYRVSEGHMHSFRMSFDKRAKKDISDRLFAPFPLCE